jgi:hypothetical protein
MVGGLLGPGPSEITLGATDVLAFSLSSSVMVPAGPNEFPVWAFPPGTTPIDGAKPRSAVGSGQKLQLMSEREIFKGEMLACPKRGPKYGDDGEAEPKHAPPSKVLST